MLNGSPTVADYPVADMDGDGQINIGDVTALIDLMLNGN